MIRPRLDFKDASCPFTAPSSHGLFMALVLCWQLGRCQAQHTSPSHGRGQKRHWQIIGIACWHPAGFCSGPSAAAKREHFDHPFGCANRHKSSANRFATTTAQPPTPSRDESCVGHETHHHLCRFVFAGNRIHLAQSSVGRWAG